MALLGIVEYKAPTPMVLAAFVIDAEAAALVACKPVAEGLRLGPSTDKQSMSARHQWGCTVFGTNTNTNDSL